MKGRSFIIGADLRCDVDALVNTRLLVQANSGAGKSWALRRLLEQTHGHLQQLVVDPEGEFASLREKFDYVLAARQGGDTLADPRSAKLLAERLLELGVSAILDIYELKAHERVRFVRVFLEALVDAPKKLWHPALVVVDEAHVYSPQHGDAESAGAVIDLCTRGRKRGYCAVLATQRLSKLHKDAAAECNNKLIGRSALDVDMDRAGEELGFKKPDRQVLRELDAGEFFAFGPALCRTVMRVKVGPVQTTHPKAGSRLAAVVPPPTEKVQAVLSKLADLPAEAEAREKTVADLKRDVATLRRQLTEAHRDGRITTPAPEVERKDVPILTDADRELLRKVEAAIAQRAGRASELLAAATSRADKLVQSAVAEYLNLTRQVSFDAAKELTAALDRSGVQKVLDKLSAAGKAVQSMPVGASQPAGCARSVQSSRPPSDVSSNHLPPGERAVLIAAGQYPAGVTREQLSVLTGYKRSSRDAYVQRLRDRGAIDVASDGRVLITDGGMRLLGPTFEVLPTGRALREHWLRRLPPGEQAILQQLIAAYPRAVDRTALDDATGYKRSSRDAYLHRLAARQLVTSEGRGAVKASDELFINS